MGDCSPNPSPLRIDAPAPIDATCNEYRDFSTALYVRPAVLVSHSEQNARSLSAITSTTLRKQLTQTTKLSVNTQYWAQRRQHFRDIAAELAHVGLGRQQKTTTQIAAETTGLVGGHVIIRHGLHAAAAWLQRLHCTGDGALLLLLLLHGGGGGGQPASLAFTVARPQTDHCDQRHYPQIHTQTAQGRLPLHYGWEINSHIPDI